MEFLGHGKKRHEYCEPRSPIGEVVGTVPAALTALVLPATTQADLGKKLTPGAYRSWQARRKGRVRGVPPHPTRKRDFGKGQIEGFYNPKRRHTSIGLISPKAFEPRMNQAA